MFSIRNFNYEKMEIIIFSSLENLNNFLIMGEFIVKKWRAKIFFLISEI